MSKILVVDDNPGVRRLLSEYLQSEGYKVEVAKNGMEALKIIKEDRDMMIILDLKMPGMDGLEVLKEMNRLSLGIPVLVMTAYSEIKNLFEMKAIGLVKDYISKPFNLNELLHKVRVITGNKEIMSKQFLA